MNPANDDGHRSFFDDVESIDDESENLCKESGSIDESIQQELAEQLVISSLLQSHFEDRGQLEDRIQAALNRFDELNYVNGDDDVSISRVRRRRWKLSQLVGSLAALLLVAACFWYALTPQTAEAAFQRIVQTVQQPVTRIYKGKVTGDWLGRRRTLRVTLRNSGIDRFVVEIHDALVKPKVIGADGDNRWHVLGRRVWRSNEESNFLRDSLLDRVTLYNLRYNQLITELPDNYEMKFLPAEAVPGEPSHQCQPIEATRITDDNDYPHKVRIWAHPDSGVVQKIEIVRERGGLKSATVIELLLASEEPVADDVFQPEYYLNN